MDIRIILPEHPVLGSVRVSFKKGGTTTITNCDTDDQVTDLQVGIGDGPWEAEKLVRKAVRAAADLRLTSVTFDLAEVLDCDPQFGPKFEDPKTDLLAKVMARGAVMAGYEFDDCKSKKRTLTEVLIMADPELQDSLEIGRIMGECANNARTLSNLPANIVTPMYLQNYAVELASRYPNVKARVLNVPGLTRARLKLILAVGQGADRTPPRLIDLEYTGNPGSPDRYVVVGKGVCYDTGGLSMKSPDNMLGMHLDMSGGAAAFAIIEALAMLKAPINVIASVPAVENSVSDKAYRPGDIILSDAGISVDVTNTDAEGRLILADALWHARHYDPVQVLDIATLTGAAHIALGDAYSGVFTTNDELALALIKAGTEASDPVWRLPVNDQYAHYLESTRADMVNACMAGKNGGASSAAWFLQRFAQAAKFAPNYAHIDIAPRMTQVFPNDRLAPGAMGAGVLLLVEYFLSLSRT